jgi:ribosomal protein S18 acetylase RimI-like enzyme
MTSPCFETPTNSLLSCVVEDAHTQALASLTEDGGRPLDAIAWLSAHLAASARTVRSVASRRLQEPTAAVREITRRDVELERMLRIAERRHSGDALAAGLDTERLRQSLLQRLEAHAETEHIRLAALSEALSVEDEWSLAESYLDALVKAPTRPHPHLPHHGVVGAIAFRVEAVRDRVLDTMDGRHVPLPRTPHEPRTPGRWGSYLLGQMQPEQSHPSR